MNGQSAAPKNVYTIPAGFAFADVLAKGIIERYGREPETLARLRILLPSRRTCRTVREAFLKISHGAPLLLPQLQPLGDVDSDELSLIFEGTTDIPPAIKPMHRNVLLAKLIGAGYDYPLAQRLALAKSLGQLMDQTYTEDLDLKNLPDLVDRDKFAEHWQITVDFLKILSEQWPNILKSHGLIDGTDRRNRLIKASSHSWQENPPDFPVIGAGSTGSIPAVAELLNTIAGLPHGEVILPGLDRDMVEQDWDFLDETHPQAMLKKLLDHIGLSRHDVRQWPTCKEGMSEAKSFRTHLMSEIMRPAETASDWAALQNDKDIQNKFAAALENVTLYECANTSTEAQIIALAMRKTLEQDGKVAALITPDRNLARRVAAKCRRWNIDLDDSGGQSLTRTPCGSFLLLCAQSAISELKPSLLLSVLKHELCLPASYKSRNEWLQDVNQLDLMLRGPKPKAGLKALKEHCEACTCNDYPLIPPSKQFFDVLDQCFDEFTSIFDKKTLNFEEILGIHLKICEILSPKEKLWANEDGEEAALFLQELQGQAVHLELSSKEDYYNSLRSFMQGISVRPRYGTHPRLMILGQLEARLLQADRVILAGLNEGTWPETPAADPWMSRPMRKNFGLPPAERSTGLSAHDFVQGFMGDDVILTRALRDGNTLTVPSRWLQRLDAVTQGARLSPNIIRRETRLADWTKRMDMAENQSPAARPSPCPPLNARPEALSVTSIEKWLKDPYALYAEKILKLSKLDPVEQNADYALKGSLLHDILHELMSAYKDEAVDEKRLANRFLQIAEEKLASRGADPALLYFWRPRLRGIANWYASQQKEWESHWSSGAFEIKGQCNIAGPTSFTLKARADRIDLSRDGQRAALIDYKSAGSYKAGDMIKGNLPQLPLEGFILKEGGFDIGSALPGQLSYIVLSGGEQGGEIISINGAKLEEAIENARAGLARLLDHFYGDNPAPYIAQPDPSRPLRYNDYLHLARTAEWSSPDDLTQEAS